MLPTALLNVTVTVKRRASTGRDSLNNPTYGAPTQTWNTVAQNVKVRFAFRGKDVKFSREGERIEPSGIMYYNPGPDIRHEDRVVTSDGIEYNVIGVTIGQAFGATITHYEAVVQLP